jgi:hypothetical protein
MGGHVDDVRLEAVQLLYLFLEIAGFLQLCREVGGEEVVLDENAEPLA